MTTNANTFSPDYALHPGEFLEEELMVNGMSQSELSKRIGISPKTINLIVKGNTPITPETALGLESVLNRSASFWLNLESTYQLNQLTRKKTETLRSELEFLKKIDVKNLIEQNWVKCMKEPIEQLKEVYRFFGVVSSTQLVPVWSQLDVNYRTSEIYKKSHFNIMAWLRRGELLAREVECKPFNAKQFRLVLKECKKLTLGSFHEIKDQLQSLCASSGVAVVFVPEIRNVSTSGAARWLEKDKALIQLSLRGKTDDLFWFNFFHEAGHILLHGRKEHFLDNNGKSNSATEGTFETLENKLKEAEANDFAANFLVSRKDLANFIEIADFSEKSIRRFAEVQEVSEGIILGQLQHLGKLGWGELRHLKKAYKF